MVNVEYLLKYCTSGKSQIQYSDLETSIYSVLVHRHIMKRHDLRFVTNITAGNSL